MAAVRFLEAPYSQLAPRSCLRSDIPEFARRRARHRAQQRIRPDEGGRPARPSTCERNACGSLDHYGHVRCGRISAIVAFSRWTTSDDGTYKTLWRERELEAEINVS